MKLKNIRTSKKLSQVELSKLLCVNQSTISKWEKGVCFPNMVTMLKLAEIFNCTIEDLIKEGK